MADEVVIDASVAAKWHLPDEDFTAEADRLRSAIGGLQLTLVVPAIWIYEVASVLSKALSTGRISEQAATLALDNLNDIPRFEVEWPRPMDAFRSAHRFNRSLIDCLYLVLAEERGCDFWTDDRKLCNALGGSYAFVRWIGDYPPPGPQPPTPNA